MNRIITLSAIWLLLWMPCNLLAQPGHLPAALANAPDSVKLWTLRHLGDSLVNTGQLTPAKEAYEQSLILAQATGSPDAIGMGYRAVGFWHESTSDYNGAIAWYLKAMTMFEQSDSRRKQAKTSAFIGFCYDKLNKMTEARRYLLHGIDLAKKGGYEQELTQLYSNMANVESHSQNHGAALVYTRRTLAYYKAQKDTLSYYGTLFNLALHYKNQQQYARSEQTFRAVLAYADQHHDTFLQGYVYVSMPAALIPQNKLAEAEAICRRAIVWVDSTGTNKQSALEGVNGYLSQIWEKRGDYRQALLFYKRRTASHDSLFNATKNQQLADLETRYQTRRKEDQIKLLDAENIHQSRQIWAGAGGMLLLSVLLGTLFWQYQRLGRSRTQIQQQSNQLTLMMKELHHRVKNNLAIVSSLLKLQSNRLDDEKAIQAVRVGQQRVEAMSLIHQRLYRTDRVTTVNMGEYLTDLAGSLMQAYGYQADTFDLQLSVDLPELDVDMAIPLGLIVNELVTNAFKYAYADSEYPLLRIDLRQNGVAGGMGMTLEVQDNGPGIDLTNGQPRDTRSFGKRLIVSLSEQLEGQAEWLKQNGTLFRLSMPNTRLAA